MGANFHLSTILARQASTSVSDVGRLCPFRADSVAPYEAQTFSYTPVSNFKVTSLALDTVERGIRSGQ